MKSENPDWQADVEHRLKRIERTPCLFRMNIGCLPGGVFLIAVEGLS